MLEIALVTKPFAEQGKMPILRLTGDRNLAELPSWVFMPNATRPLDALDFLAGMWYMTG